MKKKILPLLACLTLLSPLCLQESFAQGESSGVPFVMNLDYARFRNDTTSGYLEIYYQFYSGQLSYQKEGPHLKGAVTVKTDITDRETGEVLLRDHVVLPILVEDSLSLILNQSIVRQSGHLIPFGKYSLQAVAYDSANPALKDSLTLPLEIKRFTDMPAISDLQLCSSIRASENKEDPFYKNAHEVVANPTLVFGSSYPVVFIYAELYRVVPEKVYSVEYEVIDDAGTVVKKTARNRQYGLANTVEVATMNAVSLRSGRYFLRLTLKDPSIDESTSVEKKFYVNNPMTPAEQTEVLSLALASEIGGLSAQEVEKEFQQIKYLIQESELGLFNQLKDAEAKRTYLQQFWTRAEVGSENYPPRRRIDYLGRIALANERYSYLNKEGWRTDRGRVFLLYGKPDEMERHPSTGETKPFEIWYYFRIENGVHFVFIDRSGFGDYILVHSTKRNELQDPTWEQFLR